MCSGVKINATNVLMGAGGTSSTPSCYFMSDASSNQNTINGNTNINGLTNINSSLFIYGDLIVQSHPQTNYLYFNTSQNFGYWNITSDSPPWFIDQSGNYYGNNFIQPSDYRIKDNVQILDTTYNVDKSKASYIYE